MSERRVVRFGGFVVVFVVCIAIELVLFSVNGWREMDQWSLGAKALGFVALMAPFVAFALVDSGGHDRRLHEERIQKAAARDPSLKELQGQTGAPDRGGMKWALGGMIPAFALAILIARDSNLGPVIGAPACIILPFIGAGIGFWLSPAMRADREVRARIEAVEARQRESTEERYQRERVSSDWQATQAEWRKRTYEALVWWSSEGAKLTTDSVFILALVHKHGEHGVADPQAITARYQNPNDPCATLQRAEQVANWAITNLPDLIAEHIADEAQRTVRGLTQVLRHHHRREVVFHQEARAHALNAAVEAHRDESPEHLVERLLKECDAVALAREKGMKRIHDVAATMRAETRDQYIRTSTAGVNALLDAWLFARANNAQ